MPIKTGLRVLIVEDYPDAAAAQAELVAMFGHRVRVAYDGEAALDAAREFQPHAVLLDMRLPRKNGYEVARELRADSAVRISIIAVSGYAGDIAKGVSATAGIDYYLSKPVSPHVLEDVLATVARRLPPASYA